MIRPPNLPPPYDRLPALIAQGAPLEAANVLRGALFANILRYAKTSSPFYAGRIPDTLLQPTATQALWRTVRTLTKEDLRAHDELIKIAKPPPFAGETRSAWTSGSTGTPFNCDVSALADYMNALVLERCSRPWNTFPPAAAVVNHSSTARDSPSGMNSRGVRPIISCRR